MEQRQQVCRVSEGEIYDSFSVLAFPSSHRFFLSHSKDLTARLFSLHPIEGYRPKTFAGHRDSLVGAWIGGKNEDTVSTFGVHSPLSIVKVTFEKYSTK